MAICANPTYKYHESYKFLSTIRLTILCLLNIEAKLSFVGKTTISSEWDHCIHPGKMPHLRKAAQQPLQMGGKTLIYVHFDVLFVWVRLGTVLNVADSRDLEHRSSATFSLLNKTPSNPIQIPRLSTHLLVIRTRPEKKLRKHHSQSALAHQALLQSHAEFCEMVTTSASGLHIIEPRTLKQTCPLTFAPHGAIYVLPMQLFHIFPSKFSAKAMRLPRHMEVVDMARLP